MALGLGASFGVAAESVVDLAQAGARAPGDVRRAAHRGPRGRDVARRPSSARSSSSSWTSARDSNSDCASAASASSARHPHLERRDLLDVGRPAGVQRVLLGGDRGELDPSGAAFGFDAHSGPLGAVELVDAAALGLGCRGLFLAHAPRARPRARTTASRADRARGDRGVGTGAGVVERSPGRGRACRHRDATIRAHRCGRRSG